MRNNIFHKFIHFVFSLFLLWLNIATSVPLGHPQVATKLGARDYKCIRKERRALLDFKAYIDPNSYDRLSTWTHEEEATNDCCEWFGVTCDNQTGHVTKLDLSTPYTYDKLKGEISPSLFNLSYLNYLDLSGNSFNGIIPVFIGSLTKLSYLDLSLNYVIGGTIPESIGSLTKLTHLDLAYNSFQGTIPMSIGSLTELRHLDLSYNSLLFGIIPPQLGNLSNLQELSLRSLSSCTTENLDWLSHLSQLEDLRMDGISLAKADNWVNVILSLQKLSILVLDRCDLSQVMHPYSHSSANSSLSSSIVTLYLGNNNLNSSMYHWLFPLTSNKLEELALYGNKLDGVPKYLGNLCSLSSFVFVNNSMYVKLPEFLNNLSGCTSSMLTHLSAQNGQFIGSLSDDIQNFSSLQYLNLANNHINGTISEKVWQLPKLIGVDVSSNSLKGVISKNIGHSKISFIDLSRNSLEGVPSEVHMSNMSNVVQIELSSNNFYGPIPNVSLILKWLDLSKNNFSGGISFLCQIIDGSLSFLDLSNNSLTGQIPNCLWHFKQLQVLNLGYNNLFGKLPTSFEYLINLEVLYLNNNFYGELPFSLKNCTSLKLLYLGANGFSGNVPFWIGENLSWLYALSLQSNNFSGTIPLQICQLARLQILDLSMNNLHGTIPACINNLTPMVQDGLSSDQQVHKFYYQDSFAARFVDNVMIYWQGNSREFSINLGLMKIIDLSNNKLTGVIPYELVDLHNLIVLNLSTNALYGEIPPKIDHMKELQVLDLSRNNLSGGIPRNMSEMSLLNYLDVSYNNLSGRIPSGTQLQSFEPSRYTGNIRLCGLPLSRYCQGDKEPDVPPITGESDDGGNGDDIDDLNRWFYIGGSIGFAIGFWTVCSGLLLYRRGRHAFFGFMNSLENWIYLKVMVLIAKL